MSLVVLASVVLLVMLVVEVVASLATDALESCDEDDIVPCVLPLDLWEPDVVLVVVDELLVAFGVPPPLVLFELLVTADFWAFILAFKLAVYWLVLWTCLGVTFLERLVVVDVLSLANELTDDDDKLATDELLACIVFLSWLVWFVYLLAALLALVVVYCLCIVWSILAAAALAAAIAAVD